MTLSIPKTAGVAILILGALVSSVNAQSRDSGKSSASSPSASNSGPGTSESDPTGGIIRCASARCLEQQAATAATTTDQNPREPRRPEPVKIKIKPRENCSLEWRWKTVGNGMVRKVYECERPIKDFRH